MSLKLFTLDIAAIVEWAYNTTPALQTKGPNRFIEGLADSVMSLETSWLDEARAVHTDPALIESVETYLNEGEYGEGIETSWAFWRHVASQLPD